MSEPAPAPASGAAAANLTLTACEDDAGRRLDRILRKSLPAFPLSFINRLLREKSVLVNGAAQGGAYRASRGDLITIPPAWGGLQPAQDRPPRGGAAPRQGTPEPARPCIPPAWFAAAVVYEDDDLLVVDKPRGIETHGPHSLSTAARRYLAGKTPASLSFTPGPLHRLDRNTSGLVVFGKSLNGARLFTGALRDGKVEKRYLALVDGCLDREYLWEDYLVRDKQARKTFAARAGTNADDARKAVTRVKPLERRGGATLIEAGIATGRTHQIRAQCGLRGHPLCGDAKYGGSFREGGYYLRAYSILFEKDGKTIALSAPSGPPPELKAGEQVVTQP